MKKSILLSLLFFSTRALWAQVDTVPPVLICHGITNFFYFLEDCQETIHLSELIDTVYDDQSSLADIELGMRQRCTGEGFPLGVQELVISFRDVNPIEIWARDAAGNVRVSSVVVLLSNGVCENNHFLIAQFPSSPSNPPGIPHVDFKIEAFNCEGDTIRIDTTNGAQGIYVGWGRLLPVTGYSVKVDASKNTNPINGVTIQDVQLIARHILGIEPFNSPYKIIAADANQDGEVTTYDMVILRKLVLGLIEELPHGKSWVFIPSDYEFANPAQPFQPPFPTQIVIPNTQPASSYFDFKGVKIGDVNFSADPQQ